MTQTRVLTGDTPTGRLHLGHWVGSLENRVQMQSDYDCFFLLANTHAYTTKNDALAGVYQHVNEIVLDYLSVGIDPAKSTIFVESDVPAIFELAMLLSMWIPWPRLLRNPTIKDEIRDKNLGENYSAGFLMYPVLQAADILAFQAELVPVGEDQIPHIELTREVARRMNQLCDEQGLCKGDVSPLFVLPKAQLGRAHRLVGIKGPGANGQLQKMSKSLNNAIFLSDSADEVQQKVMQMYTDPNRLRASDPGTVENNPLWIFHDLFNPNTDWVAEAKSRYQQGAIGDVACKKELVAVLNAKLEPIRARRKAFEQDPGYVHSVLRAGKERANAVAGETLARVKAAFKQQF